MANNDEKQTYTAAELKKIGERCMSDWPPARILQQMFQYELHCQANNEKLFTHQLIRLTTMEKTTSDTQHKLSSLDNRITATNAMMAAGQAAWKSHDKQLLGLKTETAEQKKRMEMQEAKVVEVAHTIEQVKLHMYDAEQDPSTLETPSTRAIVDNLARQIAILVEQTTETKTALQLLSQQYNSLDSHMQSIASDVAVVQYGAMDARSQQDVLAAHVAELAATPTSSTAAYDSSSAITKELDTRMSDLEALVRHFATHLASSAGSSIGTGTSSNQIGAGPPRTSNVAVTQTRPVSSLMSSRYAN